MNAILLGFCMAVECTQVLPMENMPLESTWTSTLSTNDINHNCVDVTTVRKL